VLPFVHEEKAIVAANDDEREIPGWYGIAWHEEPFTATLRSPRWRQQVSALRNRAPSSRRR
jgi:hypothetical protein